MTGHSIKCDFCGKVENTFDEKNMTNFRVELTVNKGWYFFKEKKHLLDFCSDHCCQKWLFDHKKLYAEHY